MVGLASVDAESALAELCRARVRDYYDADADAAAADAYYAGVAPEDHAALVAQSHVRTPRYKPAVEVYPWVDLQPGGKLRSLYTGDEYDPEELIRADLAIAEARTALLTSQLDALGAAGDQAESVAEVQAEVEAALPFNCEHVVPQSWFAKAEPMRGDLHHLFACDARCNSFRSNTPFTEFQDFPEPAAEPGARVVRDACGKSEGNGFEPAHGKGPAARAVFYFLLRYPGEVQTEEMPPERLQMLLTWHTSNPVTEWERHRNAAIFQRQGNRNPFIDHPTLAGSLWGDAVT